MCDPQVIRFQATPKDRQRLDALVAKMEAVSMSDVMRRLIRQEYERSVTQELAKIVSQELAKTVP